MGDPSGAARGPQPVTELLAEVKAELQQATPGPWTDLHNGAVVADGRAIPATFDDARLIAKAREWLGALVQAVEDRQREVSRLRADGQRLRDELRPVLEMLDAKTENEHLIPSAVQRVRGILRSALGGDAS